MAFKKEHFCRLCLNELNEFEEIDEIMKQILDILLLKLDFDVLRDPIICLNCVEVAKKCLNFKFTCINTEKIILSFSTDRGSTTHDIKVIYKEREDVDSADDENLDICRFCMTPMKRNNFVHLASLTKKTVFDMISVYMPEMNFTIENPSVCTTCREKAEDYFKFIQDCMDTEGKIKSYYRDEASDKVKLGNVTDFLFKGYEGYTGQSPQICTIKEESNMFEGTAETDNALIKVEEELDIKEEKLDSIKICKCSMCSYVGKQKHLKNNMLVHKAVSEINMHKCSLCAFESKYKRSLDHHMLIHKDVSKIKMYKCSLCTFEAKRKHTLSEHMLVHKEISEMKMFKCLLCPCEFKRKSNISRHSMLVHMDVSEVKMHKCSLCTFETKQKSNLKKHMLVHMDVSEIKMHKCSSCAFETKHKYNLQKHMLIHKCISEIKMYNCSFCGYGFKRKPDLNRHMLVHKKGPQIMEKCSLCAFKCKYKSSLRKHMLDHKEKVDFKSMSTH